MLIAALLEQRASLLREKTFIITEQISLSYCEFNKKVNQTANYLQSLGVAKGTHVALLLPNNLAFLLLWFALAKIGAVMVPINISLKRDGLRYIVNQSDSTFLFADKEVEIELEEKDVPNVSVFSHIDEQLLAELESFPEEFSVPEALKPSDPMSIVYTSGTTSLPKGVINSQNCYLKAGKDIASSLQLHQDDVMYLFLPLFHVNPQFYGVMSSLFAGNSILIDKKFSVTRFWENARKYQFTVFTYVGTVLSILCKNTDEQQIVRSIRCCVGGGAPRLVWDEITSRFGIKVMELYGMTEIGGVTTRNSYQDWKFDSVGKPRTDMDVRIFNENDMECNIGELGEIVVRPNNPHIIFDGYYKQPDKTLESLSNLWFHTGDSGFFDENGFLHYAGRLKEIIRRKGENISPFEVETTLQKFDAIEEAAVVGISDDISEEEIKACIVLKPGSSFSLHDFLSWADEQLPAFMKPRYIEIVDEIPKTATQKVEKNKIKYLSDHVVDCNRL